MPRYRYHARTRFGRPEKGVVEAPTPDDAVAILQTRDLVVVSVQEHQARPEQLRKGVRMHHRIRPSDLITFTRSLTAMLDAGLPLLKAMETVREQARSNRLKGTIDRMCNDIRGGSTFRDALAKHSAIFSPFWITLVETGEASGQLTRSLDQIAHHLEKSGELKRKVVSAMIYPSVLVLVSIGALAVFVLKIIPTFSNLFNNFNAELPALTQKTIAFSHFLKEYILIVLLVVTVTGVLLRFLVTKTEAGRWHFDKLRLQLPLFGPVFQGVAAQQFASNMGTLLKAGVPVLHALEIVIATCDNTVVASLLEHMRVGIREGRPLAEPMSQTDIFPPMVAQMLAVGEQTGKLPNMLDEVARYYEEQVSTAVSRMVTLLEPIMLIGMGLVIGTLVISMYLPIFQLSRTTAR